MAPLFFLGAGMNSDPPCLQMPAKPRDANMLAPVSQAQSD